MQGRLFTFTTDTLAWESGNIVRSHYPGPAGKYSHSMLPSLYVRPVYSRSLEDLFQGVGSGPGALQTSRTVEYRSNNGDCGGQAGGGRSGFGRDAMGATPFLGQAGFETPTHDQRQGRYNCEQAGLPICIQNTALHRSSYRILRMEEAAGWNQAAVLFHQGGLVGVCSDLGGRDCGNDHNRAEQGGSTGPQSNAGDSGEGSNRPMDGTNAVVRGGMPAVPSRFAGWEPRCLPGGSAGWECSLR